MAEQSKPSDTSRAKKAAPKGKGPKKPSKKAPKTPEEEPVLSGRMIVALALALGMSLLPASGIGQFFTKASPQTQPRALWSVGQDATVHLTVVTADFGYLACADERKAKNGAHCEFKNSRQRWPKGVNGAPVDDNKATILQPYRTTDQNLLLTAGLWAQPEVAMRAHFEPSQGVAKSKLARFVISCDVTFVEEWENALIRWNPSDKWGDQGKAMVADIKSCRILEDGES